MPDMPSKIVEISVIAEWGVYMYFRRIMSILLALVSIMMFTACGAGVNTAQPDNTGAKSSDTEDECKGPYPALLSYVGDRKWGYIDETGKFVINPRFSSADRFQSNGLAIAGQQGKFGIINRNGTFIVEPKYEYMEEFAEGLAVAQKGSVYTVLNEKGQIVYDSPDYIGTFSDGRAVIEKRVSSEKLLYGYIDTSGNMVIIPRYKYATPFENGRAVVKLDTGECAIIDRNGAALKTFDYSLMNDLSEGLAEFMPAQGKKWGYVDENGKVVISPKFIDTYPFKGGMAVVNAAPDYGINEYGVIDRSGGYLLKPEYNDIMNLGEGMLAAGKAIDPDHPSMGSMYAIASRDGKLLTDFMYYDIGQFDNGVTYADNGKSTFFINKTGKRDSSLPAVEGTGMLELFCNIIAADIDQRQYYINRAGEIVYKPADSVTLKNGITLKEVKYKPNRNYLVYYPQLDGIADSNVESSMNERLKSMSITAEDITPEMNLDYEYEGDFSLSFYKKNLLQLQLSGYNFPFGAAHGMPILKYAPVDIKTGRLYELKDLFKEDSDYVKVLSDIVKKQIIVHGDEMGVWLDSYKGIEPDQLFYVDTDSLMLYFRPYEIAAFASGFPTFKIPFKEIKEIINTKGAFWKSFN